MWEELDSVPTTSPRTVLKGGGRDNGVLLIGTVYDDASKKPGPFGIYFLSSLLKENNIA